MIAKLKRGPKPKPNGEKKVMLKLWVKQKYAKLANSYLAKLQVKFEDDDAANKELREFGSKKSA